MAGIRKGFLDTKELKKPRVGRTHQVTPPHKPQKHDYEAGLTQNIVLKKQKLNQIQSPQKIRPFKVQEEDYYQVNFEELDVPYDVEELCKLVGALRFEDAQMWARLEKVSQEPLEFQEMQTAIYYLKEEITKTKESQVEFPGVTANFQTHSNFNLRFS